MAVGPRRVPQASVEVADVPKVAGLVEKILDKAQVPCDG
jgi:hypothetical protein